MSWWNPFARNAQTEDATLDAVQWDDEPVFPPDPGYDPGPDPDWDRELPEPPETDMDPLEIWGWTFMNADEYIRSRRAELSSLEEEPEAPPPDLQDLEPESPEAELP